MNISVSLWSYVHFIENEHMPVKEVIKHMHKQGVRYVELLDAFIHTEEERKEIKELLKELGMKVASYSISNNFVKTEEERLKQVEMVKNACQIAKFFDTNTIRVFCGDVCEGYDFDTAFDLIVKSFKECVKVAKKENIYYCLENHGKLAGKSQQVKAILDAVNSENLKATTDTGNFLLIGEKPLECVKELKDKIGLVHFKDFSFATKEDFHYIGLNNIYVKGSILGEGDVPLQEIVDFLKGQKYQGCISIETEGMKSLQAIEKCIANTFGFLNKE